MKLKIILPILIIALIGTGYWYVQSDYNIKSVEIVESGETQTLGEDQASSLVHDLKKAADAQPPGSATHEFEALIKYSLLKKQEKAIISFYSDEDVLVSLESSKEYKTLSNQQFYKSSPMFDSMYEYKSSPSLTLSLTQGDSEVDYMIKESDWEFMRLSGEYAMGSPMEDSSEQKSVYTSYEETIVPTFSLVPDKLEYTISGDSAENELLTIPETGIPLPAENGTYRISIKATWDNAKSGYRGSATYTLPIEANLPPVYEFDRTQVYQGGFIKVTVKNSGDTSPALTQSIFKDIEFFKNGSVYETLIPAGYLVKPGKYEIKYSQGETEKTQIVEILERDFRIQYLTVDPNVEASTRSNEAYAQYNKYFLPTRDKSSETKLYDKPFILPIDGRLTTEYGERRYVNDLPTSYHHAGVDLAAPAGTSVKASNSGTVVFSMELILTGNTVVIDHGQGIFSCYYHMQERTAHVGDLVNRGQEIGKVGSTGFSTGPHLHFMISYHRTNLEPGMFINGKPLVKK